MNWLKAAVAACMLSARCFSCYRKRSGGGRRQRHSLPTLSFYLEVYTLLLDQGTALVQLDTLPRAYTATVLGERPTHCPSAVSHPHEPSTVSHSQVSLRSCWNNPIPSLSHGEVNEPSKFIKCRGGQCTILRSA